MTTARDDMSVVIRTKPEDLPRRLFSEFLGSAFLAAIVVGSGWAAQSLSPSDVGLELLENAGATALGLYVLILLFGPVSGAHFNPVVTLVDIATGQRTWRDLGGYAAAQTLGCSVGAVVANVMFGHGAVQFSTHHRVSTGHLVGEVVATAGLVLVIFSLTRSGRASLCAPAVASYIGAAYFFTSSTSFANPAITVGRMFTPSFAGIAPSSVPAFIAAQLVGGALGLAAVRVLYPRTNEPVPVTQGDLA